MSDEDLGSKIVALPSSADSKWIPPPWFPFAVAVASAGLNAGAAGLMASQPALAGVLLALANAATGYLGLRSAGTR